MKNFIFIALAILSFLASCELVKEPSLFDAEAKTPPPNSVKSFYGVDIFDEEITADFWGEEDKKCYSAKLTREGKPFGDYALEVKWDKDIGICDWIGMGFGWNGWMAKDMQSVFDTCALSLKLKPKEGFFSNFPAAFAFEDYAGKQAWLGFTPLSVVPEKEENGWTHIELPLSEFNWAEQGANPANIKQLIIQLEATGHYYIDEIKIVERIGGFDKRYNSWYSPNLSIMTNANFDEPVWQKSDTAFIDNAALMFAASDSFLFVAGMVKDEDPMMNSMSASEIWNGDALEICMRTDPRRKLAMSRMSSVDRHLGLTMDGRKESWLFTDERSVEIRSMTVKPNEAGYQFELAILLSSLGMNKVITSMIYPFEFAIDDGNGDGRKEQNTWNTPQGASFHQSPASWGELVFIPMKSEQKIETSALK